MPAIRISRRDALRLTLAAGAATAAPNPGHAAPPAWQEAHQRAHGDGLAGAGFGDDAKHLPRHQLERHAVHRPYGLVAIEESDVQIVDLDQRQIGARGLIQHASATERGGAL